MTSNRISGVLPSKLAKVVIVSERIETISDCPVSDKNTKSRHPSVLERKKGYSRQCYFWEVPSVGI